MSYRAGSSSSSPSSRPPGSSGTNSLNLTKEDGQSNDQVDMASAGLVESPIVTEKNDLRFKRSTVRNVSLTDENPALDDGDQVTALLRTVILDNL